ncbi:pyruvate, water dikinase regulatory protein [Halonatronum saccharophilum]|uniref:pyruvate, water dikinase regulatory protein n=1 Tax=Halonatronum saccharophilum TaxID=150060 RepID=UPI000483B103|nr:pyruvate, water dikinase regulatory protein [Halonatronum saccharophilum]
MLEEKVNDLTIFAISDFTGKTAETIINSIAIQFDTENIEIEIFSNISNIDRLANVINKAKENGNVILAYTLVLPELCDYIEEEAKKYKIPRVDLMGPLINEISQALDQQPQLEVGLSYEFDGEVIDRVNCIDFARRCDDGKNLNKLKEADIVLIGVSRTSKTPLSIYLSHQSYKVANISLSPEVVPPKELYELDKSKIVGLIIDPSILQKFRQERLKSMDFNQKVDYIKLDRIKEEIDYADSIIDCLGCPIINITNKSIEEVADEVLNTMRLSKSDI